MMAAPFSDDPTSPEQFRDAACIHCQCVSVCVTLGFTFETYFFSIVVFVAVFGTAKVGLLRENNIQCNLIPQ